MPPPRAPPRHPRQDAITIKTNEPAGTPTGSFKLLGWRRRESNPRPLPCDGSALPTELRPQAERYSTKPWASVNRQFGSLPRERGPSNDEASLQGGDHQLRHQRRPQRGRNNPGGNHRMRDGTGLTAVDTARRKQARRPVPSFPPAPPPPAAACHHLPPPATTCHHQKRWQRSSPASARWNQACSTEVWQSTMSSMMPRPRARASLTSSSKSSIVP